MEHYPPLADFGRRIMICGPSNAGKSTLAVALSHKLGVDAVHLDRLRHIPGTDWVMRDDESFSSLHAKAIAGDAWAMDGNYSKLWPQRIGRATGIILINDNRIACFARYLVRTLFQKSRVGNLDGGKDSLKWRMVHWILIASPRTVRTYRHTLSATGKPFIDVRGMRGLKRLYSTWELTRRHEVKNVDFT